MWRPTLEFGGTRGKSIPQEVGSQPEHRCLPGPDAVLVRDVFARQITPRAGDRDLQAAIGKG